jgi:hypothetical protein
MDEPWLPSAIRERRCDVLGQVVAVFPKFIPKFHKLKFGQLNRSKFPSREKINNDRNLVRLLPSQSFVSPASGLMIMPS